MGTSTLPISSTFFSYFFLLASILLLFTTSIKNALLLFPFLILGALNILHPTIVLCLIACFFIAQKHKQFAIFALTLHIGFFDTLVEHFSQILFHWNIEALAPILLSILFSAIIFRSQIVRLFLIFVFAIAIATIQNQYYLNIFLCTLLVLLVWTATLIRETNNTYPLPKKHIFVLLVAIFIDFFWISPSIPNGYTFFINQNLGYFKNYSELIHFLGFKAITTTNLEELPKRSTLIIPDLSIAQYTPDDLRELNTAISRQKCDVIIVGDHNNMNNVRDRAKILSGRNLLDDDLTVPATNSDNSGRLQISSLIGWPTSATMNRGASPSVESFRDQILVSGDSWWSETNYHINNWTGDFIYQNTERTGRLPLITRTIDREISWTIVGDSSPFLNSFFFTNPDAVGLILYLSTGIPLLLNDILFFLAIGIIICESRKKIFSVGLACVAVFQFVFSPTNLWENNHQLPINESPFSYTSFNNHIVNSSSILTSGWSIIRENKPLSGNQQLRNRTLVFTHIKDKVTLGDLTISLCKRVGSITYQGVYLMNAQSCKVEGDAEILIGDKTFATAIRKGNHIVILDTNFLAQHAPISNRQFIEKTLKLR